MSGAVLEAVGIQEILKLLPHRYPFLLVDRIIDIDGDRSAIGIKNVTINEPVFPGALSRCAGVSRSAHHRGHGADRRRDLCEGERREKPSASISSPSTNANSASRSSRATCSSTT